MYLLSVLKKRWQHPDRHFSTARLATIANQNKVFSNQTYVSISSRESGHLSPAGRIDRRFMVDQVFGMKLNYAISACVKALSCLALIMALALSPTSEAHASSIGHDDHAVTSAGADNADQAILQSGSGDVSSSAAASSQDKADAFALCCDALCMSIVLNETGHPFVNENIRENRLTLHAQTALIDPSGFLRPPQLSI
ncbi:hypothetical protein [Sulfitobacter sp.]|uniref:hypothetical protein n=1 Tax=Sulfitobacter sp. TaxID=1903071 RepID=UPI00405822E2